MGIMKYSRLGDTFYEDKARKINQALEKINAPYYQVCKKVRGSRANKDAFDISWRKRNITCDNDYPNATTTSEKVVMKQLEKNFGISLTLLNTDTLRAIKKSLDYQKAQQTILDNKLKAREERERAAAAKKEARAMAKNNKSSKTTATKSIPSSERNDNKESANRTNEILTEKNDNITYFYTIVKNGRRKNYAKLNTLTNRVQYLSSAVPIYVKEFIKTFKATKVKELPKVEAKKTEIKKSSATKSTKAVEEKKEETKIEKKTESKIREIIADIESYLNDKFSSYGFVLRRADNGENFKKYLIVKRNRNSSLGVVKITIGDYRDNDDVKISLESGDVSTGKTQVVYVDSSKFYMGDIIPLSTQLLEFIDFIDKKERGISVNKPTPKEEEPQYTKVKATDFARKMGIEVNEMKPINEPETKFESKKLTSLNMLISAVENLIKVWTFKNRPEFFGKIIPNVVKKANNYPPLTTLSINFGDKIVIFDFSEVTKNKVDYYTIQLGNAEKLFFKRNGNMEDIGNDLLDYIELHLPDQLPADTYMTKVETSKWVKSTRGSGGEYNPETTEIIKEVPPIMIDEDEAAKFDKGLDELTKLLQQAMQG